MYNERLHAAGIIWCIAAHVPVFHVLHLGFPMQYPAFHRFVTTLRTLTHSTDTHVDTTQTGDKCMLINTIPPKAPLNILRTGKNSNEIIKTRVSYRNVRYVYASSNRNAMSQLRKSTRRTAISKQWAKRATSSSTNIADRLRPSSAERSQQQKHSGHLQSDQTYLRALRAYSNVSITSRNGKRHADD